MTATATPALLSQEREQFLARRWRNDQDIEAMHELVRAHGRLVASVANRFRNYGLAVQDLMQEGYIGLMQAADRFDPERGFRFSTYAIWWIRAAVQDYVLRNWSVVRTGTTTAQKSLFFGLPRFRARLTCQGESHLTTEQRGIIARSLGVAVEDVEKMEVRLACGDQSLNVPVYEDGREEHQDLLRDSAMAVEDQLLERDEYAIRKDWLRKALKTLTRREQRILHARHLSSSPLTLADLGVELGISKERVRQIESRALAKLQAKASSLEAGVGGSRQAGAVA